MTCRHLTNHVGKIPGRTTVKKSILNWSTITNISLRSMHTRITTQKEVTKGDSYSSSKRFISDDEERKPPLAKIKKSRSLKERSKIPHSFYLSVVLVLALSYASGIFTSPETTIFTVIGSCQYSFSTLTSFITSIPSIIRTATSRSIMELLFLLGMTCAITLSVLMLFVAPLKAGMWTGQRAKRHVAHRYMGLVFLIQYSLAWVEFATNYDSYKNSYIPATIALNGTVVSNFLQFRCTFSHCAYSS